MTDQNRLQEFKKAILFLKRIEKIRTNNDMAIALGISSSYLSQMMHGNKPFTETIYKKFEAEFNVNLNDPFSYTDLAWVATNANDTKNSPETNKELINSMKKILRLKDQETENQRKIITAQQQLIINLQKEVDVLKPLLK